MTVLRHIARALGRQAFQLEQAAGSAVAVQTSHMQQAGISSVTIAAKRQPLRSTLTNLWHATASSTTTSSSSSTSGIGIGWLSQSVRNYSQCDCPTLGGPQPDMVVVEYDEEEVDRFIALADAIEAAYPNIVVEGNPDGEGRPGSFEVKDQSGQLLFSRLGKGGWPEPDAMVESLAAACSTAAAEHAP